MNLLWQNRENALCNFHSSALQAREATARKEGEGYVYGSEGEIQRAFERLFGQPSSRFIGNSDNLMAC